MKALQCKNCGAPLNPKTLRCEYCGTQYKEEIKDGTRVYIETLPAPVKVLGVQIKIPEADLRYIPPEVIRNQLKRELAYRLAEGLLEYVKIDQSASYETMEHIVRGTIRVVPPSYEFKEGVRI